jgi:phosphate transport system permease protein
VNFYRWRKIKNFIFHFLLLLSTVVVIFPLFHIVDFVFAKGYSSIDWNFFTNIQHPVGEAGGGMRHALIGTAFILTLASLVSIPIGVVCGTYLAEYNKGKIAKYLRLSTDVLTGIPSIVVGIFAYLLLVVPLKKFSGLAGAAALSVIILPIIIRSTEEILKLVPSHLREAGLALGLPRWRVIIHIIIKGSKSGILTGIILALSRAAGESAPLLFTAFGNMYLSYDMTGPMASLPVQIYTYAISPFEDWQRLAWAGAFVLISLVLSLNLISRAIINRDRLWESLKR